MKTTIDIGDEQMAYANRYAKRTGRPLRAEVEEGLRRVLSDASRSAPYKLPDRSVGDSEATDPLESLSWQDQREEIYGEPRAR
jgi:hypothetical protein